jgi:hypothetical protein
MEKVGLEPEGTVLGGLGYQVLMTVADGAGGLLIFEDLREEIDRVIWGDCLKRRGCAQNFRA